MEQNNQEKQIEDKTFKDVAGSVQQSSFVYGNFIVSVPSQWSDRTYQREVTGIKFNLECEDGNIKAISTEDETSMTKLGSLYGFSFNQLINGRDENNAKLSNEKISEFVNQTIADKPRSIVLLFDENELLVSIVSKRHTQMKLSAIAEAVRKAAGKEGVEEIKCQEVNGSYKLVFKTGQGKLMTYTVAVDLGRNDAKGKAGIHFNGGGGVIAVCSNQIMPYVSQSLQAENIKEVFTIKSKIVHVGEVSERVLTNIQNSFKNAVSQSKAIEELLEQSQSIPMPRVQQLRALQLMRIKHKLTDYAYYYIKKQLNEETETLYGLSQCLTWVGTHKSCSAKEKETLQKLGGQVLIVGDKILPLFEQAYRLDQEAKIKARMVGGN